MSLSPFEILVIIFIGVFFGAGLAHATGIADRFEEKKAKWYREKYFFRKLHKMLILERETVQSVFNRYFFDIRSYYAYSKLMVKSFEDKLLIVKKNEIIKGFKYALALAFSGVLSEERAKETIEYVFNILCSITIEEKETLPPDWLAQEKIEIGNYVLLETYCDKKQANFVLKNTTNDKRVSIHDVNFLEIYDVLKRIKDNSITDDDTFVLKMEKYNILHNGQTVYTMYK